MGGPNYQGLSLSPSCPFLSVIQGSVRDEFIMPIPALTTNFNSNMSSAIYNISFLPSFFLLRSTLYTGTSRFFCGRRASRVSFSTFFMRIGFFTFSTTMGAPANQMRGESLAEVLGYSEDTGSPMRPATGVQQGSLPAPIIFPYRRK